MKPRPPVTLNLRWDGGLRFLVRSGALHLTLDGDGETAPSPIQALASALAGCMAFDIVLILQKGRHAVQALEANLEGRRAEEDPRRFVAIDLAFTIRGDVPTKRVGHALDLSKQKYCSVWHSLRQDIELRTSYTVVPGPPPEETP